MTRWRRIKYVFLWEKFLTNNWQHCLNPVTYVMQQLSSLCLLSSPWISIKVALFQAFKISSIGKLGKVAMDWKWQFTLLFCAFTHCKQTVTFCHQMTGKNLCQYQKKKNLNTTLKIFLKLVIAKAYSSYFVFTLRDDSLT